MAQKSDVVLALQSELETVIDSATSVATPAEHVGKAEHGDPPHYPYVGIETFKSPMSVGIGNDGVYVDDIQYSNGIADTIVLARDYDLTTEFIVEYDDDNEAALDNLVTAIEDHFDEFADGIRKRPGDLHSDVERVSWAGTSTANRPSDGVRGTVLSYGIEYTRYADNVDIAAMETVTITVEDLDDPTVYFDETHNA